LATFGGAPPVVEDEVLWHRDSHSTHRECATRAHRRQRKCPYSSQRWRECKCGGMADSDTDCHRQTYDSKQRLTAAVRDLHFSRNPGSFLIPSLVIFTFQYGNLVPKLNLEFWTPTSGVFRYKKRAGLHKGFPLMYYTHLWWKVVDFFSINLTSRHTESLSTRSTWGEPLESR